MVVANSYYNPLAVRGHPPVSTYGVLHAVELIFPEKLKSTEKKYPTRCVNSFETKITYMQSP